MTMIPAFAPAIVAGLVLLLWTMLTAQAWQQGRSRRQLQRDLARIFEQLDLLALGAATPPTLPPATTATTGARTPGRADSGTRTQRTFSVPDDGDTIAGLIAGGASDRELAARCGIAPAEARILIAMRGLPGRAGALQ
jgi:hypothetical protein